MNRRGTTDDYLENLIEQDARLMDEEEEAPMMYSEDLGLVPAAIGVDQWEI